MSKKRLRHDRSRRLVLESLERKFLLDGVDLFASSPWIDAEPSTVALGSLHAAADPSDVDWDGIQQTSPNSQLAVSLDSYWEDAGYWLDFDTSDGLGSGADAAD